MPDVNEIVTEWLHEHGYDGLRCATCACIISVDGDGDRLFKFCEQRRPGIIHGSHVGCEPSYRTASYRYWRKPTIPDVSGIVTAWLREHGYDGLFCDGCSCLVYDLFELCGDDDNYDSQPPHSKCKAGYKDSKNDRGQLIVSDKPGG